MFKNLSENECDIIFNNSLDEYSYEESLELLKHANKISKLNASFLNEMAYNRSQYRVLVGNLCDQIHYNIINIIILGDIIPENILHWRSELLVLVKKLINQSVDKSVKKAAICQEYIVNTYMDEKSYMYDTDDIIVQAINDEIRKGKKFKENRFIVKFLADKVLPNSYKYLQEHNSDFAIIFKSFIKAIKNNDINIFVNIIDKYCTE